MHLAKQLFNLEDARLVNAYDVNINSCDDCKVCHHHPRCKHTDDMDSIYRMISEATTLIIVTPVYFGAFTDRLLRIINRLQMAFERKHTHQKPLAKLTHLHIVSTAGVNKEGMFDGVKLTGRILATLFDATHHHCFTFGGTDGIKDPSTHFKSLIRKYLTKLSI